LIESSKSRHWAAESSKSFLFTNVYRGTHVGLESISTPKCVETQHCVIIKNN